MPAQYSIMVIGIEDFSARTEPEQAVLRRRMDEVTRPVAGIAGISAQDVLKVDVGDGTVMFALPGVSPARIAGPVVTALDGSVAPRAAGDDGAPPIRLRVAIHTGPADGSEPGPSAAAVSHACVLAQAQPLRGALRAAARARLAVIASDDAWASSIRHEYRTVDPAAYLPVRVSTAAGDVTAWVTVPGYPAPPGLHAAPGSVTAPGPVPGPAPAGLPAVSLYAGTVMGDQVGTKNVTVHNHGGGPR